MTSVLAVYLDAVQARCDRHADVLDTGGDELALVGADIRTLVQLVRELAKLSDKQREYTDWVNKQNAGAIVLAIAHGMRYEEAIVEEGKRRRAELDEILARADALLPPGKP